MTPIWRKTLFVAYNVVTFLLCSVAAWGAEPRRLGPPLPKVAAIDPGVVWQPGAIAVVIAGQSNSVGRGIQLAEDTTPEPGVFVLKQDGHAYPAADPLSITVGSGVGFGRTMARELIAAGYPQVWLVTCGVGSTSAGSWARAPITTSYHGAWESSLHASAGSWLTVDCNMASRALRQLGVPVVAIAWHQGETGCGALAATNARVADLTRIKEVMQTDFPGAWFVGGELSRHNTCPYLAQTNAATEQVADAYVTSESLDNLVGDTMHFNRDAQHELGRRYAAAILAHIAPEGCGVAAPCE